METLSEKNTDVEIMIENRKTMLKERSNRCVCKFCGGQLGLRQIEFTSYEETRVELFCRECNRIEFGVEPEIYLCAKFYVEETGYNYYPELDNNEMAKLMSVAKVCEIMTWENQNLGILKENGFQITIQKKENYLGECVTFSENDL